MNPRPCAFNHYRGDEQAMAAPGLLICHPCSAQTRKAADHVAAQLTDALSELSRVQVSQAAVAVANDPERLDALLDRLDHDLLIAVTASAGLVHKAGQQQIAARRATEGNSP